MATLGLNGGLRNPNDILYFDIETRLPYDVPDPFSTWSKQHHQVFAFQYKKGRAGSVSGQKADWEVVGDPEAFAKGGAGALAEERKLLENVSKNITDATPMAGWNIKEFDTKVMEARLKRHGLSSESFMKAPKIDLMLEAQKVFQESPELSAHRPFSLRAFSQDLIEAETSSLSPEQKQSFLSKYNITEAGKGEIFLGGEKLSGKDYWKALTDPAAAQQLKKYSLTDVDLLEFIGERTGLAGKALGTSKTANIDVLKKMKRYENVEQAAKHWATDVADPKMARLLVSGQDTIGTSFWAKSLRQGNLGLKTGDVTWLAYTEEGAKAKGYSHPVVGVQVALEGKLNRFDFRISGERERYYNFQEQARKRVATEAKASKKIVEEVVQDKALKKTVLAAPAKTTEQTSGAIRIIANEAARPSLSRVTPYALAVGMGADLLLSRDKTGPFWGGVAAGVAAFMTKGQKGLGRMGFIGGAYALARTIAGSIGKQHQGSLPGFEEQGEASIQRKQLTDFGSGFQEGFKTAKSIISSAVDNIYTAFTTITKAASEASIPKQSIAHAPNLKIVEDTYTQISSSLSIKSLTNRITDYVNYAEKSLASKGASFQEVIEAGKKAKSVTNISFSSILATNESRNIESLLQASRIGYQSTLHKKDIFYQTANAFQKKLQSGYSIPTSPGGSLSQDTIMTRASSVGPKESAPTSQKFSSLVKEKIAAFSDSPWLESFLPGKTALIAGGTVATFMGGNYIAKKIKWSATHDRAMVDQANSEPHGSLYRRGHPRALEGFREGGVTGERRTAFSDFGTGWDSVRSIARAAGYMKKGMSVVDEAAGYTKFLESEGFQAALGSATYLGDIGAGGVGAVKKFQGIYRGTSATGESIEQTFKFAQKTYFDTGDISSQLLKGEVTGLKALQETVAPTVYGTTKDPTNGHKLFMEYLGDETKTLEDFVTSGGKVDQSKFVAVKNAVKRMHKQGLVHADLKGNNLMVTKDGNIAVIDPMPTRLDIMGERDLSTRMAANEYLKEVDLMSLDSLQKATKSNDSMALFERAANLTNMAVYGATVNFLGGLAAQRLNSAPNSLRTAIGEFREMARKYDFGDIYRELETRGAERVKALDKVYPGAIRGIEELERVHKELNLSGVSNLAVGSAPAVASALPSVAASPMAKRRAMQAAAQASPPVSPQSGIPSAAATPGAKRALNAALKAQKQQAAAGVRGLQPRNQGRQDLHNNAFQDLKNSMNPSASKKHQGMSQQINPFDKTGF